MLTDTQRATLEALSTYYYGLAATAYDDGEFSSGAILDNIADGVERSIEALSKGD